jgi:hypothetical protein
VRARGPSPVLGLVWVVTGVGVDGARWRLSADEPGFRSIFFPPGGFDEHPIDSALEPAPLILQFWILSRARCVPTWTSRALRQACIAVNVFL